jgi:hypothetical protein
MTDAERERIRELGRQRGAELAATGVVARNAHTLRALGWPEAVRILLARKRTAA